MKKITYLILLALLLSCKKEPLIMSTSTYILYKNANGDNLLNANTPRSINIEDIDMYVLRNGIKVQLYNSLRNDPENFRLSVSADKGNLLRFYFDAESKSGKKNEVVMFIRYKDGSEDKLTGEITQRSGSKELLFLNKVWVNDVLKWEYTNSQSDGFIEIIK